MTIDLDALEARLAEYDPDAPRCPRTVEDIVRDRPDYAADDEAYYVIRLINPCCRPAGHEGECRNTRRVLGWPGYAILKELLAEVRTEKILREEAERDKARSKLRGYETAPVHVAAHVLSSRLRKTAQILIEAVGADGPMDAEDAARKAVEVIEQLRAKLATFEDEP